MGSDHGRRSGWGGIEDTDLEGSLHGRLPCPGGEKLLLGRTEVEMDGSVLFRVRVLRRKSNSALPSPDANWGDPRQKSSAMEGADVEARAVGDQ
jgi:hypothetical protein